MAPVALRSEISVVDIVAHMTAHAGEIESDFVAHRFAVARITVGLAVRAVEAEPGFIVVEIPDFPVACVMA